MSELLGARAYEALFEGNGDSVMTRLKLAERTIEQHEKTMEFWRGVSTKLLVASLASFLGSLAHILFQVLKH
jgi:hypothetical protein